MQLPTAQECGALLVGTGRPNTWEPGRDMRWTDFGQRVLPQCCSLRNSRSLLVMRRPSLRFRSPFNLFPVGPSLAVWGWEEFRTSDRHDLRILREATTSMFFRNLTAPPEDIHAAARQGLQVGCLSIEPTPRL